MAVRSRLILLEVIVCLAIAELNSGAAAQGNSVTNRRDSAATTLSSGYQVSSDSLVGQSQDSYLPRWYDMITRIPGDWVVYSEETFQTKNIPAFVGIAGATAASW